MLCYTCDVSCEASASGDDCKADFVCEENFAWFHDFGSCGAPKLLSVLKEICAISANSLPTMADVTPSTRLMICRHCASIWRASHS